MKEKRIIDFKKYKNIKPDDKLMLWVDGEMKQTTAYDFAIFIAEHMLGHIEFVLPDEDPKQEGRIYKAGDKFKISRGNLTYGNE